MNLPFNILVVLYYFVPIWAFLLWKFTHIEGKLPFVLIEIILCILTVYLAYNPLKLPKITSWLHWYTFFLLVYNFMFVIKNGFQHLERIFALSLWMVFIAGDWWELPVFIYDGFGYLNGWHTWSVTVTEWISSHIHRAYVFATLILMVKMVKIKLNMKNSLLIVAGTFFSFIGMYPYSTYAPLSTVIHILSLSLFGFIIYFGVEGIG